MFFSCSNHRREADLQRERARKRERAREREREIAAEPFPRRCRRREGSAGLYFLHFFFHAVIIVMSLICDKSADFERVS